MGGGPGRAGCGRGEACAHDPPMTPIPLDHPCPCGGTDAAAAKPLKTTPPPAPLTLNTSFAPPPLLLISAHTATRSIFSIAASSSDSCGAVTQWMHCACVCRARAFFQWGCGERGASERR